MDERERDDPKPTSANSTDDEEYELEPPDAAVVSAEDRRGKDATEAARMAIDIDEIYREADRQRGAEILENWLRNFRFRFQVKHLLIGTAVLAIALTLFRLGLLWPAIMLAIVGTIFALYIYLQWEERKQQAEAACKRDELYARRREQLVGMRAPTTGGTNELLKETLMAPAPPPPNTTDKTWQESASQERFRFQFSMRELLIAMTTAAVILGMIRLLGGPAPTATILGFVALVGLVVHALGFELPQMVILGWWFILVLYVLLSIFAAIWSSFG